MENKRILDDIKVAEFAWVGVGSMAGRILGGWGATVVKIETNAAPCPLRSMGPYKDNIPDPNRSVFYTLPNPNKLGLSLNLKKPEGREVAKKLIAWADVLTESYTPGQMKAWGLDYEEARKINPDIIYYSTCMQGQTGPHRMFRGYGTHMAALAGYYHLTGWPDKDPAGPYGAYTDFIAMLYGEAIVLSALDYRKRTGKGMYIDLSQIEAGLHFLGPVLLDYSANKRDWNRNGNRSDRACPHGAYPCSGEDRWVTISVSSDDEWHRFCEALGNPSWVQDLKFATVLSRKENEDELDNLIGEWTINLTNEEVTEKLQTAQVPAGPVQKASDLLSDPQLKHRDNFVTLEHPEIGPHFYRPSAFKLSKTPEELNRPAPCLGEHNEYVLKELLGMTDEEITEVVVAEALE
jgi:benzylsuccinate CoA-transferase BbsF subunit